MKTTTILCAVLLLLASCSKKEQYTISGSITDKEPSIIYLQQRIEGNWKNIDSVQMVNGKFEFTGTVTVPDAYYLSKGEKDKLILFVENCPISVTADSSQLSNAKVNGGTAQSLFNEYNKAYSSKDSELMSVYEQWKAEQDAGIKKQLEVKVDSLDKQLTLFQEQYMGEHLSSPVAAFLLTQIQYGKNSEELSQLLAKLDASLSETNAYKAIKSRVEALKKVAIGQKAPDFTQNDAEGTPITFSSVYAKNSYTLVDFWASWCGPCRAENPNVVAAFQQFSGKGFGVFGVSLDKDKERWLKAIADDKLTWPHVSELNGWGNEAAKEYAVNSIPANFLVDKNGTIVGANLRGEELVKKLEELLK